MQRYLGLDVHAASCTLDEIVIAGITESRGQKSDRRDAYGLAEKLRTGALAKRIFKPPREFSALCELSRMHITVVHEVVRVQRGSRVSTARGAARSRASRSTARDTERIGSRGFRRVPGCERRRSTRSRAS